MKMEPVQKTLVWTKPTVRQLSLDEVIEIFAREKGRRERPEQQATVRSYRA